MGTAASNAQSQQVAGFRGDHHHQIRRGRRATAGQSLRVNDVLQSGIMGHVARMPDYETQRRIVQQRLRWTSRGARGAIEREHHAAVRYAAHLAAADPRTRARVTDAGGFPLPGAHRRDVGAVYRWALRTPGPAAAALTSELVSEWPRVVADTYLWAATTPGQREQSERLMGAAAALADPADDHLGVEIYVHDPGTSSSGRMLVDLGDGAAVAAWAERLRRAVVAANPDFNWEPTMHAIGNHSATSLVRAALGAAAEADAIGGVANNLYVLFIEFHMDFTYVLQAGATDPARIAWEEVARFMLADDPELPTRDVFRGALNEAAGYLEDANPGVVTRWDAWLAEEREAATQD